METLRSFHALNSYLVSTSITFLQYNANDAIAVSPDGSTYTGISAGASSFGNSFGLGVELESFALRNDVILSGANTLSTQIFLKTNINSVAGPTTGYTLDFYVYFDQVICLDSSILSVKF